jgi:hypothetical protein
METIGSFESNVEGLNSDTTYWVRAVADNGVLTDKGEIKEFKTLPGNKRTVFHVLEELFDSKNMKQSREPSSNTQEKPVINKMYHRLKNIDGERIDEVLQQNPMMQRFFHKHIKNYLDIND